jgi:hypothetical protein
MGRLHIVATALGALVNTRVAHVRIMAASRAGEGAVLIDHDQSVKQSVLDWVGVDRA